MKKDFIIVLGFSILSFVPVTIIGYMNLPTGPGVIPDPINYLRPTPEADPLTLPPVEINTKIRKSVPRPIPAVSAQPVHEIQCEVHDLLSGTGKVRICQ